MKHDALDTGLSTRIGYALSRGVVATDDGVNEGVPRPTSVGLGIFHSYRKSDHKFEAVIPIEAAETMWGQRSKILLRFYSSAFLPHL